MKNLVFHKNVDKEHLMLKTFSLSSLACIHNKKASTYARKLLYNKKIFQTNTLHES